MRSTLPADAPVSGRIAVAVRPEKLKLVGRRALRSAADQEPGRVRDVAYYGDTSHVFVETAAARELSVNVQNERRSRDRLPARRCGLGVLVAGGHPDPDGVRS